MNQPWGLSRQIWSLLHWGLWIHSSLWLSGHRTSSSQHFPGGRAHFSPWLSGHTSCSPHGFQAAGLTPHHSFQTAEPARSNGSQGSSLSQLLKMSVKMTPLLSAWSCGLEETSEELPLVLPACATVVVPIWHCHCLQVSTLRKESRIDPLQLWVSAPSEGITANGPQL